MHRIIALAKSVYADSLYRSSLYLIASQMVLAIFGFLFWVINARIFTPDQIGLATTLISVSSLITGLSMLGFNTATIRYLPNEKDKNAFINTASAAVSIGAVVLTSAFIIGLPTFSPPLSFLRNSPMFLISFVVFMVVASINSITDSMFTAYRKTRYVFYTNIVVAIVKLVLPVFLAFLGTYGIFYAYISSVEVGMVLSVVFLATAFRIRFMPRIVPAVMERVWKFSFVTYLSGILAMLNSTITPLLVVNSLGAAQAAYYYMPGMILQLVMSVPRAVSNSLVAEGSQGQKDLKFLFFKSLRANYLILVPIILAVILLGPLVLRIFGKSYSDEGNAYLRYTAIALLMSVPNSLFGSILTIRKRVGSILFMSFFSAAVGLSLTVFFVRHGLAALGLSNILGYFTVMIAYLIMIIRK